MWKNKHVVLAMIIAPALAIMAWFAVDYFVAEQPQAAAPGAFYPLVARPNCRRPSDACELKNADVVLRISAPGYDTGGTTLAIESAVKLQTAAAGFVGDAAPASLNRLDSEGRRWRGRIEGILDAESMLRIAVVANGSTFYAEIPVTFFYAAPSS